MPFNMIDNISFIIQARSGSSRLPNKMLMPFCNEKIIIDIIIDKLKNNGIPNKNILIATTKSEKDNELARILNKKGYNIYRGDENNVLLRYVDAAAYLNTKFLLRICADNPFLNMQFLNNILNVEKLAEYDYASYYLNTETPAIKTHFGFFCEFVSVNSLKKIVSLNLPKYYQEHVTPYIYENPEKFKIKTLDMPDVLLKNQWLRLTIDTKDDFENVSSLYNELSDSEDVVRIIKTSIAKGLKEKMEKQIIKNSK